MNNLDIKKAMTLEEVKNFFSGCGEYKVEKADEYGLMEIHILILVKNILY